MGHARKPNRWSWRTGTYSCITSHSLLLPGLGSLRGLCRWSCSQGRGLLGPAGPTGKVRWGRLGFGLFRYFKLRNLGSSLCTGLALCRRRGSWGLSREAELESFVFLLFGFMLPLHRGQRGTKNSPRDNGHAQDSILLSFS